MKKLTIDGKNDTKFAVPLWLRDEQVKANIKAVPGRFQKYDGPPRTDPIAIVGYGPSLNDTWEAIRNFKYVMTCSGAHRFLIDRGIIPSHHVEVDPRAHKIKLVGEPHPDVEYLIASACHPDYVKHLSTFNLKLWHVFDPNEEPMRILPPGEWAATGGCGAGLRAMVLARMLGFTEQHIFGMDGSSGVTGKHAAAHPNQSKEDFEIEYGGKTYLTTPALLEAARTTPHELNQLPDVTATFHGEGLCQAIMRDYVREPSKTAVIAMQKPELISSEMRELNAQLHRDKIEFGVNGGRHAETVAKLMESSECKSCLDYGAGKMGLARSLPFPIWSYDPAIPEISAAPRPADLCVCTDVLEHIEPDKLGPVLEDLQRCTKKVGYFVISTRPAQKTYADGRNTHLIVEGPQWWGKQLQQYFQVGKIIDHGGEIHVVVGPKKKKAKDV